MPEDRRYKSPVSRYISVAHTLTVKMLTDITGYLAKMAKGEDLFCRFLYKIKN